MCAWNDYGTGNASHDGIKGKENQVKLYTGIITLLILLVGCFSPAYGQESVIPHSVFLKIDMAVGSASRTDMAVNFTIGTMNKIADNVFAKTTVAYKKMGFNDDPSQGDEEEIFIGEILRYEGSNGFFFDAGGGLSRLDLLADDTPAETYGTGYVAIGRSWTFWEFVRLSPVVGITYNFGKSQSDFLAGIEAGFALGTP
jgi:hypothetical protein